MTWALKSATKRGKELDMVVENTVEGAEPELKTLIYTFPASATQTQAQFKAMVKREVRALLDDMNAPVQSVDVTPDYAELRAGTKSADAEEQAG